MSSQRPQSVRPGRLRVQAVAQTAGNADVAVLSIGIDYARTPHALKGCVNDSNNFMNFVRSRLGRSIAYQRQMVDTVSTAEEMYPSRANMEREMLRLVRHVQNRNLKKVVLHYSGHGTQVPDRSGDEADGLDEAILPADHKNSGVITDDWLQERVIAAFGPDVQVFGLIDACHSASILDLKYNLEPSQSVVVNPNVDHAAQVMMISGCADSSVSYDAWDAKYGASGAMTVAFLRSAEPHKSAINVLTDMRAHLKQKGYPQLPQLSSSRPDIQGDPLLVLG